MSGGDGEFPFPEGAPRYSGFSKDAAADAPAVEWPASVGGGRADLGGRRIRAGRPLLWYLDQYDSTSLQ